MAKFTVAEDIRIEHDGKAYQGGDVIELTDEHAEPLLALGRIEAAPVKKSKAKAEDSEA